MYNNYMYLGKIDLALEVAWGLFSVAKVCDCIPWDLVPVDGKLIEALPHNIQAGV